MAYGSKRWASLKFKPTLQLQVKAIIFVVSIQLFLMPSEILDGAQQGVSARQRALFTRGLASQSHLYCWFNDHHNSFMCVLNFDPSGITSDCVFCAFHFSVFAARLSCFDSLYLFCSIFDGDLFNYISLFHKISRLDFVLMWISVIPLIIQWNDTVEADSQWLMLRCMLRELCNTVPLIWPVSPDQL